MALNEGLLRDVEPSAIRDILSELVQHTKASVPDVLQEIASTQNMTQKMRHKLISALKQKLASVRSIT